MSYLILLFSGLTCAVPFLFPSLWFLEWITLAPLFYLAPHIKKRYLHGLVFGMGFYLPMYYWFIELYPLDFAGLTPSMGGIAVAFCWIGLSLLQAAEMAFVPMIFGRIARKLPNRAIWTGPFLAASCFTLFEWFQSLFWHGVPWGRLALSQTGFLPMIQSASVIGSLGLGFLIALTSGFLASLLPDLIGAWKQDKTPKYRALTVAVASIVLIVPLLNGLFGTIRLAVLEHRVASAETIRVSVIQGNISSSDKWADSSVATSLDKYLKLSEKEMEAAQPDLILWPETVLVSSLNRSPYAMDALQRFVDQNKVSLIVGAFYEDRENTYNSLYAFSPSAKAPQVYHKRHLVPFGEYLPMAWLFERIPFLAQMNLSADALTPGTQPMLFDTPHGDIGGLVCFDSIYDSLARSSTLDGARLLVLSTNDSWYGDSHAIDQHNAHAMLRAVENGRAIARSANTGISTLILPSGEVIHAIAPLSEGSITADLPLMNMTTAYTLIGNAIVWVAFGFLFSRIGYMIYTRSKKRNRCNVEHEKTET